MITRNAYYEYGVPPVPFKREKAFVENPEPTVMTDEERLLHAVPFGVPAAIAKAMNTQPLPEGSTYTSINDNPDYDYDTKVAETAALLAPHIAPTVTLSDLPDHFPQDTRKKLFQAMKGMGLDLSAVSQKALALEMKESFAYPDQAYQEIGGVLQSEYKRILTRETDEDKAARTLKPLEDCYTNFRNKLSTNDSYVGDRNDSETLVSALLAPGTHYTKDEQETLASHLVLAGRVGNREARLFQQELQHMDPAVQKMMGLVQATGAAPLFRRMIAEEAALPAATILDRAQEQRQSVVEDQKARTDQHTPHGAKQAAKIRAWKIAEEELSSNIGTPPDVLGKSRALNVALLQQQESVTSSAVLLAVSDIALLRVEQREQAIARIFPNTTKTR